MTFLADENLPRLAVEALRQAGLDVLWIAEESPGISDDDVLALSVSTSRILLTFRDSGPRTVGDSRAASLGGTF